MISNRFKNNSKPLFRLNEVQLKARSDIEQKISEGDYEFENITCPICSSDIAELLSEKDRYGLEYKVVCCKKCGLIYTNPRMNQESYNKFYDTEYRKLYVGDNVPSQRFFDNQYSKGQRIYKYIKDSCPDKNFDNLHVLEVGCGAGGILYYFKQQGFEVKGIDLGKEYLDFGKSKYNLDLEQGALNKNLNFKPDIIIYSHVLEHVLDLQSEIQTLKEMCSDTTILYIEVPGVKYIHKSYDMDSLLYFQNAHVFHFTLSSLKQLFENTGFKFIRGNEYVQSIFVPNKVGVNINTLFNEYTEIVKYLKRMEKMRFLNLFKFKTIRKYIRAAFQLLK